MNLLSKVTKPITHFRRATTGSPSTRQSPEGQCSNQDPPPYSRRCLSNEMVEVEREWDRTRPTDWGSSGNLRLRFLPICRDTQRGIITMTPEKKAKWVALLVVSAKNVPRLMRKGFYWSSEHIKPAHTIIITDTVGKKYSDFDLSSLDRRWQRAKIYQMEDLNEGWWGSLVVAAEDCATLNTFDPEQLSVDNIWKAGAWNWQQHRVYSYYAIDSDHCLNALYPGLPLKGCWPQARGDGNGVMRTVWRGNLAVTVLRKAETRVKRTVTFLAKPRSRRVGQQPPVDQSQNETSSPGEGGENHRDSFRQVRPHDRPATVQESAIPSEQASLTTEFWRTARPS